MNPDPLPIPNRDSLEFSAALLVGAAIGILATRALRPERSTGDRIRRRIRRPLKRVRREGHATRTSAAETLHRGGRLGTELRDLGQEFVDAARTELGRRAGAATRGSSGGSGLGAAIAGLRAFRSRISRDS